MQGAYDREPMKAPSKFLKLSDKGEVVKLRLLSEPYREPRVWNESTKKFTDREVVMTYSPDDWLRVLREPDYTINEVYYWVVKDRDDNRTKIFTGTAGVYKKIKKYAETIEWGDPTQYDLVITRTEQPGSNYYTVEAMPNKGNPTQEELAQATAMDIKAEIPIARRNSEDQIDDISSLRSEPSDSVDESIAGLTAADIPVEDLPPNF